MSTKDFDSLVKVARTSKNIGEKIATIEHLGVLETQSTLRDLYKSESNPKVKEQLIESLMMTGDIEILSNILENETGEKILTNAISVAAPFANKDVLNKLIITYQKTNRDVVKKAIIEGYMNSHDSMRLAELLVTETNTNTELQEDIIEMLGVMNDDVATAALTKLYKNQRI